MLQACMHVRKHDLVYYFWRAGSPIEKRPKNFVDPTIAYRQSHMYNIYLQELVNEQEFSDSNNNSRTNITHHS